MGKAFQGLAMVMRVQAEKNKSDKRPKRPPGQPPESVPGDGEEPVLGRHRLRRLAGWLCWGPRAGPRKRPGLQENRPLVTVSQAGRLGRGPHGPESQWERGLPRLEAEHCRVHSGPLSALDPSLVSSREPWDLLAPSGNGRACGLLGRGGALGTGRGQA